MTTVTDADLLAVTDCQDGGLWHTDIGPEAVGLNHHGGDIIEIVCRTCGTTIERDQL